MENEYQNLKKAIKKGELSNLYIFYGKEDYMMNFYIDNIVKLLVVENFSSFNLEKFDESNFNILEFSSSIESLPAFSEKKVILLRDIDIFKLNAQDKEQMVEILNDLPDYVCIIFYYLNKEFKMDGRAKIANILKKTSKLVEFNYITPNEMQAWVKRRFKANNLHIDDKTIEYLNFLCGMSMTNLAKETEKLFSYCSEVVTTSDIENVCIKILDAQIFDVTDMIIKKDINGALSIISELVLQKNDEFAIISVINSQFQRLYTAKLGIEDNQPEKFYMDLWSIRSPYAIKITLNTARNLSLKFLRKAVNLCASASIDAVSLNIDKSDILKNLIINIGAIYA